MKKFKDFVLNESLAFIGGLAFIAWLFKNKFIVNSDDKAHDRWMKDVNEYYSKVDSGRRPSKGPWVIDESGNKVMPKDYYER